MDRTWDVVVLGTGSGGKLAALLLARQGLRVLAVERGRFGGYCPYVACVPAKSILASAHAGLGWAEAVRRRDDITDHRDDTAGRRSLEREGVTCLRGRGRLDGRTGERHRLRVEGPDGDVELTARIVVLATGSTPDRPPVEGIETVPTWTSEEALSADTRPGSLVVLGGGPVGCELGQAFALLGTRVTLVEVSGTLLSSESPWVGRTVAEQLADDGVQLVLGATAQSARPAGRGVRLHLDDGRTLSADRVLLAGGRSPCSSDLGAHEGWLDDAGHVSVDARCRVVGAGGAVPGLFAVGDLTAVSAFTHSANYQARIVAGEVAGSGHDAVYDAVPRAVYVSPSVLCTGLTPKRARERGREVRTARADLADVEKAALFPRQPVRGGVELVLDAGSGTLLGASCVGPEADSWGAELALAVRAGLGADLLADHVRAFPTWSEVVSLALERQAAG